MGHGKRGIKNDGEKTKVKTNADWIGVSCEFGLCLQRLFMVFLHPYCRLRNGNGEVAEWLKAHAWKACLPREGNPGSNPGLSTKTESNSPRV